MSPIIPLLTITIIWVVVTFIGLYVNQYRLTLIRMRTWLRNEHHTLEKYPSYRDETYKVYNIYIPGMDQWLDESRHFINILWLAQVGSAYLIYVILIGQSFMPVAIVHSCVVAGTLIGWRVTRARRYIAEGTCKGVQATLEAIKLQEERGEI